MAPTLTCVCGSCRRCKHREYMRTWYWRNREQVCETARASRVRRIEAVQEYDRERGGRPPDPEKRRARAAVKRALKSGRLTRQPCEVCGAAKTDAHHDDYSRPLDIRWLCRYHHGVAHRREIA